MYPSNNIHIHHDDLSCCDSRRAVIIVESIFGIAFNVIGMILLLTAADIAAMFDDDEFSSEFATGAVITSAIYGFGILISLVVIFGAITFNAPLVVLGIVWTVAQTIAGIVLQAQSYNGAGLRYPIVDAIIRISVASLLIYPLAVFAAEVRNGIMSKQTYPKERHSCCCV